MNEGCSALGIARGNGRVPADGKLLHVTHTGIGQVTLRLY